jgi:hypothetical protein
LQAADAAAQACRAEVEQVRQELVAARAEAEAAATAAAQQAMAREAVQQDLEVLQEAVIPKLVRLRKLEHYLTARRGGPGGGLNKALWHVLKPRQGLSIWGVVHSWGAAWCHCTIDTVRG